MLVRMIARQAQRPTGVTYVTLALRSHTLHSFTPLAPTSTPLNLSPTPHPPPHKKVFFYAYYPYVITERLVWKYEFLHLFRTVKTYCYYR